MKRLVHRALRSFGLRVERHRDIYRDLQELVGTVRCAVDGGAYRGDASRTLLALFPESHVHAFEPQPELFARLQTEAKGNPNWHVHPFALSDREGEAAFHVPNAAFTGSLLTPSASFGATKELHVRTTTLAEWAARASVAPDFVKLDLQGAELNALRGAAAIMPAVRAAVIEVNFVPRYEGCARFGDVATFFESAGFHLHRLYEIHSAGSGRWQFADALFVRGS
jgi:FkbM family methyltransferase